MANPYTRGMFGWSMVRRSRGTAQNPPKPRLLMHQFTRAGGEQGVPTPRQQSLRATGPSTPDTGFPNNGRTMNSPRRSASPMTTSKLTCPECGTCVGRNHADRCLHLLPDCAGCGALLRPKKGDCCVFCSYGSVSVSARAGSAAVL